jgi:hypothetical protein
MLVADGVKRTQPPLAAGPRGTCPPQALLSRLPYQTISCRHPYSHSILQSEPEFLNWRAGTTTLFQLGS